MNVRESTSKNSTSSSDSLWCQFKAGSQEAYAVIYQRFFFYLLDYGRKIGGDRELVRDTIQDLFIELWNSRERLSDTSSIQFYLTNALKYKLYRALAKEPHPRSDREAVAIELPWEDYQIEEEVSQAQRKRIHQALLQLLTARQREVVELKFYQELTNDEIAATMQISKKAVYNTLSKAMKVLRQNLKRAALSLVFFL